MTGHRSFNELRSRMSAERRARNTAATEVSLREMALDDLRRARQKSQEELARELQIEAPTVATIERSADLYLSSLRRSIEAEGGTLEITARFPDGSVSIKNFRELSAPEDQ